MLSIEVLGSITRWITIIGNSVLALLGVIGSLANIFIFSRRRFLKRACSQYILVGSFINLVLATIVIPIRIVVASIVLPTFFANDFVCKLRNYMGTYFLFASLWCSCLAVFDQWLSTSQSTTIRGWSNFKLARRLLFITVVLWSLIASPNLFLSYSIKMNNIWVCVITNEIYLNYYGYFLNPFGLFLLPLLIFGFFGFRTYININNLGPIRRIHGFKRQLIRMILVQVVLIVVSSLPFGAQFLYTSLTATWIKNSFWIAIDGLMSQIGRLYFSIVLGHFIFTIVYLKKFDQLSTIRYYYVSIMRQIE